MHTRIVGILNLTPDSFSGDGIGVDTAASAIETMIQDGIDVVDIGAESTRPGATPLTPDEEWTRLQPVMQLVPRYRDNILISLDTRHAKTAEKALDAGVHWLNDVNGFKDVAMLKVAANTQAPLVFMHSLTVPADPNVTLPEETDAVSVLQEFVDERLAAFDAAGIARKRLIFDPGLGFGKTAEQSLEILQRVEELREFDLPLLIGHSRKSFLKLFTDAPPAERDGLTLAASAYLMERDVDYIRVHNTHEHAKLRAMMKAQTA